MNRALLTVNVVSFAAFTSFYLMLGVTPLYAIAEGASEFDAALTSTVFMLATVATELVTTPIMRRVGPVAVLAMGIVLMGVPVFVLIASGSLAVIMGVSVVRGIGFAFMVIASAAMVAALADPRRQGRALATYGVVVGVTSVVALPLGTWLVEVVSYDTLFVAAGAVAVFGVVLPLLRLTVPRPEREHGLLHALRTRGMVPIAIAFCCATLAAGVINTWAPVTAGSVHGALLAAIALFLFGLGTTGARWVAGHIGDRTDPRVVVVPGLLALAAGLVLTALVPGALLPGTLVAGAGLGFVMNAAMQLMMQTAGPSGYGAASALWNIAYDLGLAGGAFGFGLFAGSYGVSLLLAAAVAAAAIAVLAPWRRSGASASSQVTRG